MRVRLSTLLMLVGATAALGAWVGLRSTPIRVEHSVADVAPKDRAQFAAIAVALALAATEQPQAVRPTIDPAFGLQIAHEARRQLDVRAHGFRDDCSGYTSAVLSEVGVPMDGRVASLWQRAVENEALHWDLVPRAGDLVFFDDTWDRDHDGRLNDDLTHIGIVLDVEPDGTVVFGHAGLSSGRGIGRLNLNDPDARDGPDGRRWNSTLRNPKPYDPPGTVHLAGALWAAFARVDPETPWR